MSANGSNGQIISNMGRKSAFRGHIDSNMSRKSTFRGHIISNIGRKSTFRGHIDSDIDKLLLQMKKEKRCFARFRARTNVRGKLEVKP